MDELEGLRELAYHLRQKRRTESERAQAREVDANLRAEKSSRGWRFRASHGGIEIPVPVVEFIAGMRKGHTRYGLSKSALEAFIASVTR